jgi:hypothetical protein
MASIAAVCELALGTKHVAAHVFPSWLSTTTAQATAPCSCSRRATLFKPDASAKSSEVTPASFVALTNSGVLFSPKMMRTQAMRPSSGYKKQQTHTHALVAHAQLQHLTIERLHVLLPTAIVRQLVSRVHSTRKVQDAALH